MKLFLKNKQRNKQVSLQRSSHIMYIERRENEEPKHYGAAREKVMLSTEECQGATRARRGGRSHPATYVFTLSSHVGSCTSHSLFSKPIFSALLSHGWQNRTQLTRLHSPRYKSTWYNFSISNTTQLCWMAYINGSLAETERSERSPMAKVSFRY